MAPEQIASTSSEVDEITIEDGSSHLDIGIVYSGGDVLGSDLSDLAPLSPPTTAVRRNVKTAAVMLGAEEDFDDKDDQQRDSLDGAGFFRKRRRSSRLTVGQEEDMALPLPASKKRGVKLAAAPQEQSAQLRRSGRSKSVPIQEEEVDIEGLDSSPSISPVSDDALSAGLKTSESDSAGDDAILLAPKLEPCDQDSGVENTNITASEPSGMDLKLEDVSSTSETDMNLKLGGDGSNSVGSGDHSTSSVSPEATDSTSGDADFFFPLPHPNQPSFEPTHISEFPYPIFPVPLPDPPGGLPNGAVAVFFAFPLSNAQEVDIGSQEAANCGDNADQTIGKDDEDDKASTEHNPAGHDTLNMLSMFGAGLDAAGLVSIAANNSDKPSLNLNISLDESKREDKPNIQLTSPTSSDTTATPFPEESVTTISDEPTYSSGRKHSISEFLILSPTATPSVVANSTSESLDQQANDLKLPPSVESIQTSLSPLKGDLGVDTNIKLPPSKSKSYHVKTKKSKERTLPQISSLPLGVGLGFGLGLGFDFGVPGFGMPYGPIRREKRRKRGMGILRGDDVMMGDF